MAEKIVLDGIDVNFKLRIPGNGKICKHLQPGRSGSAGGDAAVLRTGIFGKPQCGPEFGLQQAQHPDAVFQLGVFFIKLIRRQFPPCLQIQFVSAPEDAGAVLLQTAVTECSDLVERFCCMLRRKGSKRIEPLAVTRQTYRDHRNAVHRRVQRSEFPHTAVQLFPVVQAGAADNLAVHDDARIGEAPHDPETLSGTRIAQHLHA